MQIHLLMRAKQRNLIASTLSVLVLFSCTRKTETYQTTQLSDYVPLQVGKYITYQLDSTVFTVFGSVTETHSYREKQVVDAQIPDGMGRPSYRILRYLRDTTDTSAWTSAGTYFITPITNTIEVIENNLRFLKLILPIQQDNTWKGNRYLPDNPFSSFYDFKLIFGIDAWNYTYSSVNSTEVINNQSYTNTITIDGSSDSFNMNPDNAAVTDVNSPGYVNNYQEKYAKGIGLVYQQFTMWEYQPVNIGNPTPTKIGFGVKRSIIDHN